tara:strand:- start:15849 stop:17753 length:1905 start_codon:yes stop_codon:yes gene_type:complete
MKEIKTPWGEVGYLTYKRTYARRLNEKDVNSPTEEFVDTVNRVVTASNEQLGCNFSPSQQKELTDILLNLKGSVAGRFWWQLGTKTVDNLGLLSLQNCAFTNVNEPVRPFTWAMDALMLGSGVGYNIQKKNVYQLPKLKDKLTITRQDTADADFILSDTREGWVKLLGKILKAHFYSGEGFSYSTMLIRGKGAPIKGFGGTASGPEVLCDGLNKIHEILNNRANDKLEPIDCLDIMNIIGQIVVAGNVRRSAQIALGDCDDEVYLKAKRWDLGSIPNWRAMSNNSVVCDDSTKLPQLFWDTYEQGEPYGLINLDLSRKIGRIGETEYPDPSVEGYNPCAEQSLADKETCCLAEVFLPNIETEEEFRKVITYLYRINKHSLALPCHLKETEEIVHANMRMGIGVTGVYQATEEQRSWLSDAYTYLRTYDDEYSKIHGFPPSIKLTTVKPSGTLSLLAGVTPGGHPSPAGPYYIRRIRISSDSPLVDVCKSHGYVVEPQQLFDGSKDKTTMVAEFPCSVPETTPIGGDISAVDQLELVKWLQANWSDNSVSVTVYYKKEELDDIKQWLADNYIDNVKTVSFLLYTGHGFVQAPYETISKEEYDRRKEGTTPIDSVNIDIDGMDEAQGCEGGACPVK